MFRTVRTGLLLAVILAAGELTSFAQERQPGSIAAEQVHLRAGASRKTPSKARLTRGNRVEIIRQHNDWYEVTVPATGQRGYVHRRYVKPESKPVPSRFADIVQRAADTAKAYLFVLAGVCAVTGAAAVLTFGWKRYGDQLIQRIRKLRVAPPQEPDNHPSAVPSNWKIYALMFTLAVLLLIAVLSLTPGVSTKSAFLISASQFNIALLVVLALVALFFEILLLRFLWTSVRSSIVRISGLFLGVLIAVWLALTLLTATVAASSAEFVAGRCQTIRDGNIVLLDRKGVPFYRQRTDSTGTYLPYHKLPKFLVDALLFQEDRRYFDRSFSAVEVLSMGRAALRNLSRGKLVEGASTLDQQLARLFFSLPMEKNFTRKVREYFFASVLKSTLPDDEVLALYSTLAFLGGPQGRPVYGFVDAARSWCGKELAELSPAEATALVALLPGPVRISSNHPYWLERRNGLLQGLHQKGQISRSEFEAASRAPLPDSRKKAVRGEETAFLYAVDAVFAGIQHAEGLSLQTTIDADLQRAAYKTFNDHLGEMERRHGLRAGVLNGFLGVLDVSTGEVLALTSRDPAFSQFNWYRANRQMGSLVKPFIYALARQELRIDADEFIVDDGPIVVNGWIVENFDGLHPGSLAVQDALAQSNNVAAVKTGLRIGLPRLQSFFERLGLEFEPVAPALLGTTSNRPLYVLAAYAAFANGGRRVTPQLVRTLEQRDGKTLVTGSKDAQIISRDTAEFVFSLMQKTARDGTAQSITTRYGIEDVAAKTGSSAFDAMLVAMTRKLACLVIVGVNQGTALEDLLGRSAATGASAALPIAMRFLVDIERQQPGVAGLRRTPDPIQQRAGERLRPGQREQVISLLLADQPQRLSGQH